MVRGFDTYTQELSNPVIRHFGWLKTDERKRQIVEMCDKLWKADQEFKSEYKLENEIGSAAYDYWEGGYVPK